MTRKREGTATMKHGRTKRSIAAALSMLLLLPLLPPTPLAASYEPPIVAAAHALPADEAGTILVSFEDGDVDGGDLALVEALGIDPGSVTRGRDGLVSIEVPADRSLEDLTESLGRLSQVRLAAPSGTLSVFDQQTTPDDDFYLTTGRLVANDYRDELVEVYQRRFMGPQSAYPHSVQFEPAWGSVDAGAAPVRIAVLDTGYTAPSADMQGASIYAMGDYTTRNPVTGGPTADVADGHGHGTMVVSTIAATAGNALGLAGAAGSLPVEILVYKVLRDDGTSRLQGALDINEAIMDAVDAGATVINCSFGDASAGPDDLGEAFRPAVDYALAHDVVVVAAAGNDGRDYVVPPAAVEDVIAVGSIDYAHGTLSAFSNHGRGLDLVATGEDVPVLTPGCADVTIAHGTSFAAPLVSTAAALLQLASPSASAHDVMRALLASADPYPSASAPDAAAYGNGKLDVTDALAVLHGSSGDDLPVDRHAGSSRYDTASTVSRTQFPGGATVAVLASGEDWPDALSAGVLARSVEGPLLLTRPNALPGETARELTRLAPDEVLLVGGPAAVSEDVLTAIRARLPEATVTRISGSDRYATAREVATQVSARGGLSGSTAVVASGRDFPDALAAVPAAAHAGWPILLTDPLTLSGAALGHLESLGVDRVVVVGGTMAVGAGITSSLTRHGFDVERVSGPDRYATARLVADWAIANGVLADAQLGVATGRSFPDALAGGPFMAGLGGPLILADSMTSELDDWLLGRAGFERLHVFGGTGVVSSPVESDIAMSLLSR